MESEDKPKQHSPHVIRRSRPAPEPAPDPLSIDTILDQAMAEAGDEADWSDDDVPDAPWAKTEEEVMTEAMAIEALNSAQVTSDGDFGRGDKVTGTVIHVSAQDIFVDIGGKSEALLDCEEMRDDDGQVSVKPGDTITLYVATVDSDGVRLSYKMALEARSREAVRTAYAERAPLEGKIAERRKGGFEVRFRSGQRAFLPLSQVELRHVPDEELDDYVGRSFDFLITKYESDGRDLVVSRSQLLREERDQLRDELRTTLAEDQIREGTVARIVDFGAFVDLGGLDGLVHISEIQWGHSERPQDKLRVGESVRVKVLRIDHAKGNVSLSIKQAAGNPWDDVGSEFVEGGVYAGQVTRVEAFGAFVELKPGLEGLVHVSELAWERVRTAETVVQPGEKVTVKLIRIEPEKRRIGLSIKQLGGDPWNDVVPAWMRGQLLEGSVDKVAPFGVLVRLAPGVSGLIPISELGMDQGQAHLAYQAGKAVTVELSDIDSERRRIRLLPSDESAKGERAAVEDYRREQRTASLGTFGDLLGGLKIED